jgi:hypothetical protein
MAFSSDIAKLVSDQLVRFVSLNRHQLAGQVANLDFWLAQVRNALDVLDGYQKRFDKMRSGQEQYVAAHGTKVFDPKNDLYPEKPSSPSPPRRVPDDELREARKTLCESAYQFLVRCCNERFIPESELRAACKQVGISVEASDLKTK